MHDNKVHSTFVNLEKAYEFKILLLEKRVLKRVCVYLPRKRIEYSK